MLGGKKKYKCKFEVKVEKVEGLPDKIKGNPFRIEYARGKDQSGLSRTLTMTSKNMAVNYSFKLECNLLYEEKKGEKKFSEKTLTFQIVAEKSKDVKKESNIGKAEFNLVDVAIPGAFEAKQRIECHGKDKSDIKCVLVVSFKTEVLKIDGKKLVKADPSKKKDAKPVSDDPYGDLPDFGEETASTSTGPSTVKVDGQEYDLQTDVDISEGGMDSDSDAKTENDYLSDSDEKDPFEEDSAPTEEELKVAKKMEEEEAEKDRKKAEETKKAEEARKAAEEEKRKATEAANKAAEEKKTTDDKKSKEEEKKRKEEDEKKKKEDEKRKKEEEKRIKEEEERRKEEERKAKKEAEKKAKEDEEKRKKEAKGEKAGQAASTASTSKDAPKDTSSTSTGKTSTSSKDAPNPLEDKVKQLTAERDSQAAEFTRLSGELEAERKTTTTLKKDLKAAEASLKKAEENLKTSDAKVAELTSDVKRLQERSSSNTSTSASGAGSSQVDKDEISRLELLVRQLRREKEAVEKDLEDANVHALELQRTLDTHDAGYAAKQISDLELENEKLRGILDDHNLLKGNLIQEIKHRQSERSLRVEQHQKDVAAGKADPEEITSYKRHSRQSSVDSSSATSPRTNGSSDKPKDVKDGTKDGAKDSGKPAKPAKPSKKDDSTSSATTLVVPEPKKPKKSALSMEDEAGPSPKSAGSKRVSVVASPLSDDMDFASGDTNERVMNLEQRIKHGAHIEQDLYNAKVAYDENGVSAAARELAAYILEQKAMSRNEQHSESSHDLLVHTLSALYSQAQRHAGDVDVLLALFQWGTSLLSYLQSKTETLEDAPQNSHMTWPLTIDHNGIVFAFDAVIDATEAMADDKYNVQRAFDDLASDATPGEAFLSVLDKLLSYIYVLIFESLQSLIDEDKLTELFFGQTSQLAAALNGSPNPAKLRGSSSSVVNKKPAPPKPMSSFTMLLEPFLAASKRHQLHKVLESQLLGQFFFWSSSVIVNALVRQPESCCAATGMSLKISVSHVETWISQNTFRKLSGWVEDQFAATREAANVLTIDKHIFQSIDALEGIFTTLNIAQIHKLLTQFQPDDFAPDPVPKTTLDVLRNTINKTNAKVTYLDGTTLIGFNFDN